MRRGLEHHGHALANGPLAVELVHRRWTAGLYEELRGDRGATAHALASECG